MSEETVTPKRATQARSATVETPDAEPITASAVVDMVTVDEINPVTNRWEKVTKPRTDVVTAGNMREFNEGMPTGIETNRYAQDKQYFWAHKDNAHPSTVSALTKGYRPVVPAGTLGAGHIKQKVDGWDGEVVSHGDLVLMEIPKGLAQRYDDQYAQMRARERADLMRDPAERAEEILDANNVGGKYGRVTVAQNDVQYKSFTSSEGGGGMAEAAVSSLNASREAMRNPDRGAVSFSGFNGPANNGAVPESPFLRANS